MSCVIDMQDWNIKNYRANIMNDSDGGHSCWGSAQELTQDPPENPKPRWLSRAVGDVNGRRSFRA